MKKKIGIFMMIAPVALLYSVVIYFEPWAFFVGIMGLGCYIVLMLYFLGVFNED